MTTRRLLRGLPSLLGGAIGGIVAVSVLGASSPRTSKSPSSAQVLEAKVIRAGAIQANSIYLVDLETGKTLTTLSPSSIHLVNRENKAAVNISAWGPAFMAILDEGGQLRARFGLDPDTGAPRMSLYEVSDHNVFERIAFGQSQLVTKASGVKETTVPGSIVIFDEVGNVVWRVPR